MTPLAEACALLWSAAALNGSAAGSVTDLPAEELWKRSEVAASAVPMTARMSLTVWKDGRTVASLATVTHGTGGRYRLEYEAPPDARGRTVWFDGRNTWQKERGRSTLTRIRAGTRTRPAQLALLFRNYRAIREPGIAQAGGRDCYLVRLAPRHPGKGGERRWIDRKTLKPLRIETTFSDGGLARLVSYQQVTLPAAVRSSDFRPPSALTARTVKAVHTPPSFPPAQAREAAARARLPAEGPLGFRLVSATDGVGRRQFLYSDGLESVSVFVQRAPGVGSRAPAGWRAVELKGPKGIRAFHRTHEHADAVAWFYAGNRYTVVGHLEQGALVRFAAGLEEAASHAR